MKSNLNLKHKKFADEYISNGFNGKQAYLKVYPLVADNTALANASKLLNDATIKGYILDIQQKLNEKSLITKEDLVKDLIAIKNLCFTDKRAIHNSIKAIESISKLLGLNEPEKVDIKGSVDFNIKDIVTFED